jgi:prophage regulatory protein
MNDQPHSASDELLRLQQVETISGLKRSQLYALIGKGEFPKPAKLGAASRWSLREIQDWIADKLSKRDAARIADTCDA